MQANAPWQDRTVIHYKDSRGRRRKKKGGAARRNLRAVNMVNQNEKIDYAYGIGEAREIDRKRLRQINAERRKAVTSTTVKKTYTGSGETGTEVIRGAAGTPRTETEMKALMLSRVPRNESAVYAFNKRFEKERTIAMSIRVTHGNRVKVPYAIWLEIANNGRYSIIGPTMDHWAPLLMRRAKQLANLKPFKNMNFGFPLSEEQTWARQLKSYEWEGLEPWSPEKQQRLVQDRKDRRRRAKNAAIREAGGTVPQKDIRPRGPHTKK